MIMASIPSFPRRVRHSGLRHSRAGGNPASFVKRHWVPACAGTTRVEIRAFAETTRVEIRAFAETTQVQIRAFRGDDV